MFCPNCGANVPENQAFCASCGAQMAAAPQTQKNPTTQTVKLSVTKDAMFGMRVAIVALALLSIFLIFFKGIGIHSGDDSSSYVICEWNDFFKNYTDSSAALPITLQIISIVFIVAAAAAAILPVFMPELSKIKYFSLVPAVAAVINIILYAIMIIVAMAIFEGFGDVGAHPAMSSWLYLADLAAVIFVSCKMTKASK